MASQGVLANSRLAQMQLRFQQKQQQEREQRRIEMAGTGKASDTSIPTVSSATKNFGNGKVRQMFDERRRGAGIDRSKPLNPISSRISDSTTSLKSTTAPVNKTSVSKITPNRKSTTQITPTRRSTMNSQRSTMTRSETFDSSYQNHQSNSAGNNDRLSRTYDDFDSYNKNSLPKDLSSLSLHATIGSITDDRNNNQTLMSRGNSSNSNIKLNPVITKKSPQLANSNSNYLKATRQKTPLNSANSRSSVTTADRNVNNQQSSNARTPSTSMSSKGAGSQASSRVSLPAGMGICKHCGRHFNEDRLAKHEVVCQKVFTTKRKVFDAGKQRILGTEAENFNKKPTGARAAAKTYNNSASTTAAGAQLSNTAGAGPKKNNWRRKHEEFISAIRAAKQVQVHLARGGKLSDLPPPPPSLNPDYIQCPHCLRRFNETAAARHIPKCATMLHNKPKPGAAAATKKR